MAIIIKTPALISAVEKFSEAVWMLTLQPERMIPDFKPGQFLHLAYEPYDPSFEWPESRVFSIANSPTRKKELKVLVSKKGRFTNTLFELAQPGFRLWLKLPYGDFTFSDCRENIVLIAGGTGISPFISYLEYCIDKNISKNIILYYGIRSKELLILEELFKECMSRIKGFRVTVYNESVLDPSFQHFPCKKGRLDISQILEETKELDPCYYLSGPHEMIISFRNYLLGQSVPVSSVIIDSWQ